MGRRVMPLMIGVLVVVPLFAQQPSLQVGGIELTLGMTQDAVLERLTRVYDVRHIDESSGAWVVVRRGGPPFETIGSVSFAKSRLTFISKDWAQSRTDDGTAFARALTKVLQPLDGARCTIRFQEREEFTQARLMCGDREIDITAGTGRGLNINGTVAESVRTSSK
jgi:hypothetical protein